ncbi:MAG: MFS transporter [Candidatus Nanoarchaeia archaeon]
MKFFEKGELKLLWPFYLTVLIQACLYIWPAFLVIFFNQKGLSFFQMSILFATVNFCKLIFEIPTGAIADIFGRKFSVILGIVLESTGLILTYFVNNFYMFILLACLMGISYTLGSGANEALIVDHLHKNKRKDLVHSYFSKEVSIVGLGVILSGLVGAVIVKHFGVGIISLVSAVGLIAGGIILLIFVNENFKGKYVSISKSVSNTINYSKFSIKSSLKHPVLLFLIVSGLFFGIEGSLGGNISWQSLLVNLNFQVYWLGYLFSIAGIVLVLTPYASKYFLKLVGSEKNSLLLTYIIYFLCAVSIMLVFNWQIACLVYLSVCFFGVLSTPIEKSFFQKHTLSKYRATITSFRSLVSSTGSIIGNLVVGYLIDIIGPKMTLFYSSFLILPIIFMTLLIKDNYKKRKNTKN